MPRPTALVFLVLLGCAQSGGPETTRLRPAPQPRDAERADGAVAVDAAVPADSGDLHWWRDLATPADAVEPPPDAGPEPLDFAPPRDAPPHVPALRVELLAPLGDVQLNSQGFEVPFGDSVPLEFGVLLDEVPAPAGLEVTIEVETNMADAWLEAGVATDAWGLVRARLHAGSGMGVATVVATAHHGEVSASAFSGRISVVGGA